MLLKGRTLHLNGASIRPLLAYALGQAIGYGTDLLIFTAVLTVLRINMPIVAHLSGKFGSAGLTYFYHARYSFPGEKANSLSSSTTAYVSMIFCNIVFTSSLLKGLILISPNYVFPAKIVSDVLGVLMTYIFMRTLVFPRNAS